MPRDGSGGYSPPQNSWNPAINNAQALPNDWMAILNDQSAAIQASVAADGQTPITGSLNLGGNRLRNVGAPQGSGDALRFEQMTKGSDVPSAPTIAFPIEGSLFDVTGTTTITGIAASFPGRTVIVRFTGALTLTNGTSLALLGGTNVTTQAGDIAAFMCIDGTVWRCWLYPQRIVTDFYGPSAPQTTWPGMKWADSGTNTRWRRDAANASWVNEGILFQRSMPGMELSAISTLTGDFGPITCTDLGGVLYAWSAAASRYVPLAAPGPMKTASAQFVRATNEILMSGIVTDLGLEVGDVIQITGSASNNFTMTVEVITDANDINVNYEHRNGAGPLSLTNETVVCTIKRIAKWYNAPPGLGQAWVNVTSKRAIAANYVNTTGRTIVTVATGSAPANGSSPVLTVNGSNVGLVGGGLGTTNPVYGAWSGLVPNGGSYGISGGAAISMWAELR